MKAKLERKAAGVAAGQQNHNSPNEPGPEHKLSYLFCGTRVMEFGLGDWK